MIKRSCRYSKEMLNSIIDYVQNSTEYDSVSEFLREAVEEKHGREIEVNSDE